MIFSPSISLIFFLTATLPGYYLIQKSFRNAFLLLLAFYTWGEPRFVLIMITLSLINYYGEPLIDLTKRKSGVFLQCLALVLAVLSNLVSVFDLRCVDLTLLIFNRVFGTLLPLLCITLPVGMALSIFRGISYTLDVHLTKFLCKRNCSTLLCTYPSSHNWLPTQSSAIPTGTIRLMREISTDRFSYGVRCFSTP